MKTKFPIWQITFPICVIFMFTVGTITAIYMVNGRYIFNIEVTPQGIKVITDVDKRDGKPEKLQN
jgi:hypothetical protein